MNDNASRWALAALLAVLLAALGTSAATSNASNKAGAAGSTLEILGPAVGPDGTGAVQATILSTLVKAPPPGDLLFQVTLECALWTKVKTVGNDMAEATA